VTLSYLFWCTKIERVDLPRGLGTFHLGSEAEKAEGLALEFGNCLAPLDRLQFLKEVAEALDVPFSEIERQQLFRVVDEQQLRQLADAGVDIQLHSHRHRWSAEDGRATVEAEVADNRRFLERIVSHRLEHFCYPSGVYASHHGEWLASLGVKSATTIDPGLNYADTPKFALRRLMDGHPVSDIEFEAEVTGVMEIVRAVRERRLCSMLFRRFGARPEISHPEDDKGPQKMGASVIEAAPRWGADFYDRLHTEADCPETPALYKPLFRQVVKTLGDCGSRTVLEVGCGSGFLAEMILREHAATYRGFDFSPVAIRNAGRRTGHPELFARADALDPRSYACDYDTIVCTEVLEHIDADLDVIRLWRDGALCVCTVPNFDFDSHVRYFRRSEEVVVRYGDLVDIRAIIRVARPIIPDGRLRSYLRNLRWSRDDPSRFLGFMGIQTFDRLGGWFLFFGAKKHQGR
jgi:SAM-dependent methyltransferase